MVGPNSDSLTKARKSDQGQTVRPRSDSWTKVKLRGGQNGQTEVGQSDGGWTGPIVRSAPRSLGQNPTFIGNTFHIWVKSTVD